MLLRPHLRILRTRLILASAFTLAIVLVTYFGMTSDDGTRFGIFWHSACTCPVDPSDTRVLLSASLNFAFIAIVLGFMGGFGPALVGANRFMLTRPQSRQQLLLAPALIAGAAIALLPGLSWLLLLGWLHLVHAPAAGYLVRVLEVIPSASQLGPHPSFLALVSAAHLGRVYLAGVSLALAFYVFLCSSRWLLQSRFWTVKLVGVLSSAGTFLVFPAARFVPNAWLFLPSKAQPLDFAPSTLAIALHFAFAAAWFYGTLWVIRDSEL